MSNDETAAQPTGRVRRSPLGGRLSRRGLLVIAVVAAVAIGIGGYSLAALDRGEGQQEERAEEAEQEAALSRATAQEIAAQVRAACQEHGEVAQLLGDVCEHAEQVAEEPAEPVLVTPTEEQLRPLVQQYVADWLSRNPPRDGRDGETPSVHLIADLIVAELERNPPPLGEDGRTPTPEEIRPIVAEEVAAYLLANPAPAGQPGRDGADGAPGRDGVDGRDGQPPHSWTTTRCDVLGQCTTERCERTDHFDPAAPTYVCSEEPA